LADGRVWLAGGAVAEDTGRVFFTLGGTDYVCSGAAITQPAAAITEPDASTGTAARSSTANGVVVTAAHCVTDGFGTWAKNWAFVPGYRAGNAPYGIYPAHRFFASALWDGGVNENYDVAFVSVHGLRRGLPVAFSASARSAYVFGYPAEPPYNGERIRYCDGPVRSGPGDPDAGAGVRCGMTAGDSGGPWLAGFSPATGTGTVVAVSAFKYSDDSKILYSAALGPVARSLYDLAERSTSR
jgi:V8-like Glu-specific endopeptidase